MKKTALIGLILAVCLPLAGGCAKKKIDLNDSASAPAAAPVATEELRQQAPVQAAETGAAPAEEEAPVLAGLETIHFDFDSYTLTPQAREILNRNAEILKANPSAALTIEGHCDERGADAYNLALGEKRAQAVLSYLKALGLATDGFRILSYGEEKPADPAHTEEAWAKNRRAAFM